MRSTLTFRLLAALAGLSLSVSAAGCSSEPGQPGQPGQASQGANVRGRLKVVTTVSPITSIVAAVAGDLVEIAGVVPEGTNSHTFEPSPSIASELADADVVYMNGLQLEEPTRKLAEANMKDGAELVLLGELTISEDQYIFDFSFPEEEGKPNPHLWTNPLLAKRYAELVKDDLSKRLPANAEAFSTNYQLFAAKVDELAAAMRTATETVRVDQRKLLTYHDSFPYFARDFGWTVIGAIQPSEFDEPTPRDVAGLIEQVRKEKVKAIFGSEVFPSPVLEQIGKESGATYVDTLRDDDLPGVPGDPAHSYLGLMRSDFVSMITALGGNAGALDSMDITLPTRDRATYAQ